MSTITREFTKEQLQQIIETDHVQCGEASALARIALASLEAEPVAWAHRLINKRNGVVHPWVYGSAEACPSEGDIFNIEVMPLYTSPPALVVPAELHPDTLKLVTDFSSALAEKLYKAQLKYGYDEDWKQDGWPSQCQADFQQHIAKGDPSDVAAYCAFMWYHGWKTEPAPVSLPDEQHSERFNWTLGQWAEHVGGHYHGNDPANYYEFGSFMAVAAMLCQFGTVQQKIGWNACRAAMLQRSEPVTDNTNQQLESLAKSE